jgi:hypothetical protein
MFSSFYGNQKIGNVNILAYMLQRIVSNVIPNLMVIEATTNPAKISQSRTKLLWRRTTKTTLRQNASGTLYSLTLPTSSSMGTTPSPMFRAWAPRLQQFSRLQMRSEVFTTRNEWHPGIYNEYISFKRD